MKQMSDFEYRYENVDINTYINADKGDKILFCGKYYKVDQFNNTTFIQTGRYINGNRKYFSLKELIYCYHNNITQIPDNKKVIPIYNDRNISIQNLILVDKRILGTEDINDWNIKYEYFDKNIIKCLENAVKGDSILLYGRNHSVYDDGKGYLRISLHIYENGKYMTRSILIHRLVYEYYNKCILTNIEHIHHIDHNSYNNKINNLQKLSEKEHIDIHAIENMKPVIDIVTEKIYKSISEASEKTGFKQCAISSYCYGKYDNIYHNHRFMFLEDYSNFPNRVEEKLDNLKNFKGYNENLILHTVYTELTEESYSDYNFRYNNVYIEDYYNVKVGQKVYYCSDFYTVQNNNKYNTSDFITIRINGARIQVCINYIVYIYFYKYLINNKVNIININGNKRDNHIENLINKKRRKIINIETDEVYNSLTDTSRETGLGYSLLQYICKLKNNNHNLYFYDDIFEYDDEYIFNDKSIGFGIEDLEKINNYRGFEEFTDFKEI